MQHNKIICIILSFTIFNTNISMEKAVGKAWKKVTSLVTKKHPQEPDIPVTEPSIITEEEYNVENESVLDQTQRIHSITDHDVYTTQDLRDILLIAQWLNYQRNNTSAQEWSALLHTLYKTVNNQTCDCECKSKMRKYAVMPTIDKIAQPLQPGENCSQSLVTAVESALKNVKYF
jgi:hypothetical protein